MNEDTLIKKMLKFILRQTVLRIVYLAFYIQQTVTRIKTIGKKEIVHLKKTYSGQKILLLALYEKGRLRPDIQNLLIVAKQLNMYTIAINTLSLLNPDDYKHCIDCYIERPNFGRDFGSYQTGFNYIFKNGWENDCERLLMLNDSVFYSKKNLKQFLHTMIDTDTEVLGATENHMIQYHLGSFCISMKQNILKNEEFKKFWFKYRNSDIRLKVISEGEMKLSKILRQCVSAREQFSAKFNLAWLADQLEQNSSLISQLPHYYRVSTDIPLWTPPSLNSARSQLLKKNLHFNSILPLIDGTDKNEKKSLLQEVTNNLMACFGDRSQIHQNGIMLHYLGLPLIKLDALYRGVFSVEDVEKICSHLSEDEKEHFRKLMYSRPFGGRTLLGWGWKRLAFSLRFYIQQTITRIKTIGKKEIVHLKKTYSGQKILLLALYEKGRLRPDIQNLLIVAKQLNMYTIAINTHSLLDPDDYKHCIDCYIERPNFGRDFGSYKAGFNHIFKNGWENDCERLLMLNDSVFYSKKNLKQFLHTMIDTDTEAFGATESHEYEYHLESFCISMKQNILKNEKFKKFWLKYRNTDIPPKVISEGEMKLSKILRQCVSAQEQFSAKFNLAWLADQLQQNSGLISQLPHYHRVSTDIALTVSSLNSARERLSKKKLHSNCIVPSIDETYENEKKFLLEEVKNNLMACFGDRSQIHQNGIMLHYLGLPLIKLDALYRGVFCVEDVEKICSQLSDDEKQYFRQLMYFKPFGGRTLFHWKRIAFAYELL